MLPNISTMRQYHHIFGDTTGVLLKSKHSFAPAASIARPVKQCVGKSGNPRFHLQFIQSIPPPGPINPNSLLGDNVEPRAPIPSFEVRMAGFRNLDLGAEISDALLGNRHVLLVDPDEQYDLVDVRAAIGIAMVR